LWTAKGELVVVVSDECRLCLSLWEETEREGGSRADWVSKGQAKPLIQSRKKMCGRDRMVGGGVSVCGELEVVTAVSGRIHEAR